MAGYFIFQIEVTDPERYREYAALVPDTVKQYGGEFLVRGGEYEVLEGQWPERRVVVLRFPSVEQAKRWYDSAEYAEPKKIRQSAARGDGILIEGS